jgi:HSP20 family protein
MARRSLIPMVFGGFPELQEEFADWMPWTGKSTDVTISEDETHVFIETALPGVDAKDIEVTFDRGALTVKGAKEEKEEDKKRKYYRKATSTFSYQVMVPGDIDESVEPEATFEKGVMKISFAKKQKEQPKKIQIKS